MTGRPNDPNSAATRWRLVLGKYARPRLDPPLAGERARIDAALDRLYSQEYAGRGGRNDGRMKPGPGSLDPSALTVPQWLDEVRTLFPQQTCEQITRDAVQRYQMTEILRDTKTLEALTPSPELLGAVLALKGQVGGRLLGAMRRLVARVVEDLKKRIMQDVLTAFAGRIDRSRSSSLRVAKNFDARRTIRRNLKNFDAQRRRIIVDDPRFFARVKRHLPWDVILCVDQSGSMAQSVIHSAVLAGILTGLPAVRIRLVVFDTSVVDLTDRASDPVEVLMSVQLGGGTNIGQAVEYCETIVAQPRRTIFALVTDFGEGADPRVLIGAVRRLQEAGVKQLGLAALDANAKPFYDREMAERLAAEGMEIAALTPGRFAEWLAKVMGGR